MSRRTTIQFEGQQCEADDLDFEVEKEGWSAYKTEDGAVIRLKNVAAKVFRLIGRTKEDGSPVYVLSGAAVLTTDLPSNPQQPTQEEVRSDDRR